MGNGDLITDIQRELGRRNDEQTAVLISVLVLARSGWQMASPPARRLTGLVVRVAGSPINKSINGGPNHDAKT